MSNRTLQHLQSPLLPHAPGQNARVSFIFLESSKHMPKSGLLHFSHKHEGPHRFHLLLHQKPAQGGAPFINQ